MAEGQSHRYAASDLPAHAGYRGGSRQGEEVFSFRPESGRDGVIRLAISHLLARFKGPVGRADDRARIVRTLPRDTPAGVRKDPGVVV